MTTFLTITGLFIVGGMAFAFALVRMADKPAPKPPLRRGRYYDPMGWDLTDTPPPDGPLTETNHVGPRSVVIATVAKRRGPYESSTVHGRRVPPTTDERGLQ